jgi:G3E family GTPase
MLPRREGAPIGASLPHSEIVPARFGREALERILNTGRFDFDQVVEAAGWLRELRGEQMPEAEEYGISGFVCHARRPFHPARFHQWINPAWSGVIRSKACFWAGCGALPFPQWAINGDEMRRTES